MVQSDIVPMYHAAEAPNGNAIVIGDPELSRDRQYKFIPLPGAREEAKEVSQLWERSPNYLAGEAAERPIVNMYLGPKEPLSLIYFATHGISDPVNPMDGSFLARKGGHPYGRDIKYLVIYSHPLIDMSACQTGLGKTFEAGTFGLARAWWHAGAGQVVMSLWNIDDAETRNLMVAFIRLVRVEEGPDGLSQVDKNGISIGREEMLRRAMLEVRDKYQDPALWASFLLFGIPTKLDSSQHQPAN